MSEGHLTFLWLKSLFELCVVDCRLRSFPLVPASSTDDFRQLRDADIEEAIERGCNFSSLVASE